jgi:hypothetical protein
MKTVIVSEQEAGADPHSVPRLCRPCAHARRQKRRDARRNRRDTGADHSGSASRPTRVPQPGPQRSGGRRQRCPECGTLFQWSPNHQAMSRGAPSAVLARCTHLWDGERVVEMSDALRDGRFCVDALIFFFLSTFGCCLSIFFGVQLTYGICFF